MTDPAALLERLDEEIRSQRHSRGDMMTYGSPDLLLVDLRAFIADLLNKREAKDWRCVNCKHVLTHVGDPSSCPECQCRTFAEIDAPSEALVSCILRYGGRCRDCADNDGTCEGSGLPCDPAAARRTIRHVLTAKTFYDKHPEFVIEASKFL